MLPKIVDEASDGALQSLREMSFLRDTNSLIRAQGEKAWDDMLLALIAVARALLGKALDRDPSAPEVTDFFNDKARDPAFATRMTRLLSQCLRTPNETRRRLLARALLSPPSDPDIRDRVDAAIERLHESDVRLLRELVERDPQRAGFKLLRKPDASVVRGLDAIEWGQTMDAVLSNQAAGAAAGFKLPTASLFSLRAAECIDVTVPSGLPDATDQGLVVRRTSVLPLGRAVLEVLYYELTGAEIESSAREPAPASGLR